MFTPERLSGLRRRRRGMLLQRGRRCSRRRGKLPLRRYALGCRFNEAGVVHAGEGKTRGRHREAKTRFNEAGVVHAGEVLETNLRDLRAAASTRPALFTPERPEDTAALVSTDALQRGRRCSRRRGRGSPWPGARRSGFNEAGVVHAGEGARASSTPCPTGSFNEAGVVHAGEDQARRRCTRRPLGASTRPALFTPERGRADHSRGTGGVASTRPALFTPERAAYSMA